MEKISTQEFLKNRINSVVVDVRTPAEYEQGHIPDAINIPLFSNEERAEVGTIYKKQGNQKAVLRGLEIVGPKLSKFSKEALKCANKQKENKNILVYCWRGGMRSSSMGWLFETVGLSVYQLIGGYKKYRNFIRDAFSKEANLIILGGKTGTGKTDILKELRKKGEQIIDLEGRAHHKGSAFGGLGQEVQPTSEQFENNLYEDWSNLDLKKTIWVEDESRSIGRVIINEPLLKQMRKTTVINLQIPAEIRASRLFKEYGHFSQESLIEKIENIKKRLGGEQATIATEYIKNNQIEKAISTVLYYYDKAYDFSLARKNITTIDCSSESGDPLINSQIVLEHYIASNEKY